MIKINFISLFCDFLKSGTELGVISQATEKKLVETCFINPRDFTTNVHKTVDDKPFGGGDGMVMMVKPLEDALKSIDNPGYVIYLSPQGKRLNHKKVLELRSKKNITFVCGRYGGIDQRFINKYVDEELSVGDFVLSGGELAALVTYDAIVRQIEGVLGHKDSSKQDSFSNGLLESPQYTRPRVIDQKDFSKETDKNSKVSVGILKQNYFTEVPKELLSGDHAKIAKWKEQVSILTTLQKKPYYLFKLLLSQTELKFTTLSYKKINELEKLMDVFSNIQLESFGLSKKELEKKFSQLKFKLSEYQSIMNSNAQNVKSFKNKKDNGNEDKRDSEV